MSQISNCPRVTVILSYWEASYEVSKLRYNNLLYSVPNDHTVPLFLLSPGDPREVNGGVLAGDSVDHQSSPLSLSTGCRCAWGPA